MGTNALTNATPGQDIPASHHNELVTAFIQDIVPRDANRLPGDLVGNLGTSVLRFLRTYAENYHIGKASNNLKIYEGVDNEIWIENGNSETLKIKQDSFEFLVNSLVKFRVNSNGIDWANQSDNSIIASKLQTVPTSKIESKQFGQIIGFTMSVSTDKETININTIAGKKYLIVVYIDLMASGGNFSETTKLKVGGVLLKNIEVDESNTSNNNLNGSYTYIYSETTTTTNRPFEYSQSSSAITQLNGDFQVTEL